MTLALVEVPILAPEMKLLTVLQEVEGSVFSLLSLGIYEAL